MKPEYLIYSIVAESFCNFDIMCTFRFVPNT